MTTSNLPSAQDLLVKMRAGMGHAPAAMEKSTVVNDGLIQEYMRSRAYAIPEGGPFTSSFTSTRRWPDRVRPACAPRPTRCSSRAF